MNVFEKIEEIRKYPEHVRMRYVWLSVAISMLVVFLFWIFSIVLLFKNNNNNATADNSTIVPDLSQQIQGAKSSITSIKSYSDIPTGVSAEGIKDDSQQTNQTTTPSVDTTAANTDSPSTSTETNQPAADYSAISNTGQSAQ